MQMDMGDEAEEQQILMDWITTRNALNSDLKKELPALVDELNQIRVNARK